MKYVNFRSNFDLKNFFSWYGLINTIPPHFYHLQNYLPVPVSPPEPEPLWPISRSVLWHYRASECVFNLLPLMFPEEFWTEIGTNGSTLSLSLPHIRRANKPHNTPAGAGCSLETISLSHHNHCAPMSKFLRYAFLTLVTKLSVKIMALVRW